MAGRITDSPGIFMNDTTCSPFPGKHIPREVLCAQDYEVLARHFMPVPTYAYIAGGSARDLTLAANRKALDDLAILPRLLRNVSQGHTRLQLLDRDFRHPLLLAPLAFQGLVHPQAELETARAAEASDSCLVVSTLASQPLEKLAPAAGSERWFQLYFQSRRALTLDLLQRAEAAGYTALVVPRRGDQDPQPGRPARRLRHAAGNRCSQPGELSGTAASRARTRAKHRFPGRHGRGADLG